MSYTINRLETSQNNQGQDEVFFSIVITDELGTYNFARWLTQTEYNQYIIDNDIDTIIVSYLPLAKTVKIDADNFVPDEFIPGDFAPGDFTPEV